MGKHDGAKPSQSGVAMLTDKRITVRDLEPALALFFETAGPKVLRLASQWPVEKGAPVFTQKGAYTARGWTEWTQGFLYGMALLHFDATGDRRHYEVGRDKTLRHMAPHLTHTGVHDHGFNNISTYGALRRLALEGAVGADNAEVAAHGLALKVSGAVQASRWTNAPKAGGGFIYSFNGPHSLFSDTIRSCRSLVMAHRLGHVLSGENDARICLLARAVDHIRMTLKWNVYYGRGRDTYDVRGRVAHEGIFNTNDGCYRCPGTQQGYSPFSTWTRGLAWVLLGCAEQLEYFEQCACDDGADPETAGLLIPEMLEGAQATADFYLENTAADGIPLWDTGAPGAAGLGDYRARVSEPDNDYEPFDSSAAAIAAQGLLRLGRFLGERGDGAKYWRAGLTVARTLLSPPYLSASPRHQGLILHSVYHRPNGWDYTPKGSRVPNGESSMWGDYHAMELAVYLRRILDGKPYLTFFGP